MSTTQELLELRKKINAKRPNFRPQDSTKRKKIRKRWVFPAGMHSKMRLKKKGKARKVMTGFGSPDKVRGLHSSGLEIALVSNITMLSALDNKTQGVLINGSLGNKKRLEILKKSSELGFRVLNFKDVQKSIAQLTEKYSQKKKDNLEATKIKEDKIKQRAEIAKMKEAEEKKKEDELASKVLTEEEIKAVDDKEKQEKEAIVAEQEKILTQK